MESRLTLIKQLWLRQFEGVKRNMWLYKCSCGNEKEITITHVKNNRTKSCGCLLKETTTDRSTKHWRARTRIYRIWSSMKHRCNNVECKEFKYYWAKWIQVCERWNDFINFYEDNKDKYIDYLTIDRMNVKWNYEPSNCRWITREENAGRAHAEYKFNENGVKVCKRWHVGMYSCIGTNCKWCQDVWKILKSTKINLALLKSELTFN